MQVIPVLDLAGGQVVHAVRGDRARYAPVHSRLCEGSEPLTVARALLAHSGAATLYVADLDALQGGAPQWPVVAALQAALPGTTLWLDAAFGAPAAVRAAQALGVLPVIASEVLSDAAAAAALLPTPRAEDVILSLDRRAGQMLDAAGLWQRPASWPRTVVAMTLERVGTHTGPDLTTLAALRAQAPDVRWVGAGGLRHAQDAAQAHAVGAQGWLVASALHAGVRFDQA